MLAEWVVYIKYLYQKGLFGLNTRSETTICVKAESESGAAVKARRQLESELKEKIVDW